METLERINWVDLIALILILRISYVGSFLGIGKQILPFISLLFILSISLYYYDNISLFIIERFSLSRSVSEFFIFLIIAMILSIITRIINKFIHFKKPEILVPIERLGGMILGLLRAVVITGLVFTMFLLVPIQGVEESVKSSLSGNFIIKINLDFYSNIINALQKGRRYAKGKSPEPVTTMGMLGQLTREKDYKLRLFNFDLKDKARFFKEEVY